MPYRWGLSSSPYFRCSYCSWTAQFEDEVVEHEKNCKDDHPVKGENAFPPCCPLYTRSPRGSPVQRRTLAEEEEDEEEEVTRLITRSPVQRLVEEEEEEVTRLVTRSPVRRLLEEDKEEVPRFVAAVRRGPTPEQEARRASPMRRRPLEEEEAKPTQACPECSQLLARTKQLRDQVAAEQAKTAQAQQRLLEAQKDADQFQKDKQTLQDQLQAAGQPTAVIAIAPADSGHPPGMLTQKPPVPGLVPVQLGSAEHWEVEARVQASLSGQMDDYKGTKFPLRFNVEAIDRIDNPTLTYRYQQMRTCLAGALSRPRTSFHGCRPSVLKLIAQNGLLRVGHPLNPSEATDPGFFGIPTEGVYTSRYADYCLKYAHAGKPLAIADMATIVLFDTLPGTSFHVDQLTLAMKPTAGYHSHSSPNFTEWYLFNEAQANPRYIITLQCCENLRVGSDDGLCRAVKCYAPSQPGSVYCTSHSNMP